jgi:SagB-type dehydrogenase family enzyme
MIMTNIITLPEPQKDLGFPLMKAIEMRRTKRKWQDSNLSDQEISNILWAACGITQEEAKRSKSKRTAPSACNSQEIKVYIAMYNGLFLYDEKNHQLVEVLSDDIRMHIGTQKMMRSAPVGLIYVSDYSKMTSIFFKDDNRKWFTSGADTGFISQNIYLYCAAANLSTAVLGLIDKDKLHKIMGLSENEKVVYTQVIGKSLI